MTTCKNCGAEIAEGQKFCAACGATVEASETYTQQPQYNNAQYNNAQYNEQSSNIAMKLNEMVSSAFKKGIAAVICASFPIAAIVAIILGVKAKKLSTQASAEATTYNIVLSKRNIVARILGIVGMVYGIIMTVFWAIYIPVLIFGTAFAMAQY